MICKQCTNNTMPLPEELEVAQDAFYKLMNMPLKQLNKSQWYDEFSNRMMFQPIIGLFKQYESTIPYSASSHKAGMPKTHYTIFRVYHKAIKAASANVELFISVYF